MTGTAIGQSSARMPPKMSDPLAKAKALQAAQEEKARVRAEEARKRRVELHKLFPVVSEMVREVESVFGKVKVLAMTENGRQVVTCRGCSRFVESGVRWIRGRDVSTPERCGVSSQTFPKTCDQFLWSEHD